MAHAQTPHWPLLLNSSKPRVGRNKEWRTAGLAEGKFGLFVTADQNIRYQQNLTGRRLAILELSTNDIGRIQSARELIEETIATIRPDEFRRLILL